MRQQSNIQVTVRDVIIGGERPLICLPLVAQTQTDLLAQVEAVLPLRPDLLEWRVDGYDDATESKECLAALRKLRKTLGNIPLIYTFRIREEGGMQEVDTMVRQKMITAALRSGDVDIVDIELCNPQPFIEAIIEEARTNGVKVILSHHNFTQTPTESFMIDKLRQAQAAGADIVKLAAMPQTYGDVLRLLTATNRARTEAVDVPIVTMAMGEEGVISRLAGGLFGSDITFAIGSKSSAPGQVPIDDLRTAMTLLYAEPPAE
jgi:3-dehydroquinate dehydratase I